MKTSLPRFRPGSQRFLALALTGLFWLLDHSGPLQTLENWAYDRGLRAVTRQAPNQVDLITIDDATLERLDGWPLPARQIVRLMDILQRGAPRVIGFTFPLTSDDDSTPLLANAFRQAGHVVLAAPAANHPVAPTPTILWPRAELAAAAARIGVERLQPDPDQVIRAIPLIVPVDDRLFPSLALDLASEARHPDHQTLLAPQNIRAVRPYFHPGVNRHPDFPTFSMLAILEGNVPAERFRDRVVLIGPTAPRLTPYWATPAGRDMPPLEIQAQAVSALLDGQEFHLPEWAGGVRYGLYAGVAMLLLLAPAGGVGARTGTLLVAVLLGLAVPIAHVRLLDAYGLWVPMMGPLALLMVGSLLPMLERIPTRAPPPARPSAATDPLAMAAGSERLHRVGRYPVLTELSRDGLGTLLLGRDPESGQAVILRLPGPSLHRDAHTRDQAQQAFLADGERWLRLRPAGVVALSAIQLEADPPHLVMAHVPISGNLERHVHPDDPLPLSLILYIITRAALTLDPLHQQGLTHGNLRPEDLIFDATSRQVWIKEFGLARLLGADPVGTGLSPYAAPEALDAPVRDPRSDLYALGAIFFHLLTGHPPFKADDPERLRLQILKTPAPLLTALRPDLPAGLNPIVARTLAKEPTQRHSRGEELARELVDFIRAQVQNKT
ncbi:MAG: CHASE2 domain-containing protein [Magnetococcales bacterium]|nr:CHASE2 domain-containing protein [Magnetococcales bacterium]